MPYQPSRLVRRSWSVKPRLLSGHVATPLLDPPESLNAFDELGFFAIACNCGNSHHRVLGHPQAEGFFACPLLLECVACKKSSDLFDVKTHGYDAELGHGCFSIRGEGNAVPFSCPKCEAQSFTVLAGVSYQIEPIEDLPKEAQDRAQDLFDWFDLIATCEHCGTQQGVTGYECA